MIKKVELPKDIVLAEAAYAHTRLHSGALPTLGSKHECLPPGSLSWGSIHTYLRERDVTLGQLMTEHGYEVHKPKRKSGEDSTEDNAAQPKEDAKEKARVISEEEMSLNRKLWAVIASQANATKPEDISDAIALHEETRKEPIKDDLLGVPVEKLSAVFAAHHVNGLRRYMNGAPLPESLPEFITSMDHAKKRNERRETEERDATNRFLALPEGHTHRLI